MNRLFSQQIKNNRDFKTNSDYSVLSAIPFFIYLFIYIFIYFTYLPKYISYQYCHDNWNIIFKLCLSPEFSMIPQEFEIVPSKFQFCHKNYH